MLPPFQIFLDEQREVVYRYLLARLGPADAEDCFQETFVSALRAYPRLRPGSNPRAWVLRIAERKAIDFHRARARRPVPREDMVEAAGATQPPDGDPGLWKAVAALPAKQRAAIVHRFVNDLPYAEIGEAIGSSEQAARQSVRAGLRKLREVWSGE